MRVISKARLKQFWQLPGYQDAEGPLRAWYTHVNSRAVSWQSWGGRQEGFRKRESGWQLRGLQHRRQQVPLDHAHPVLQPKSVYPQNDAPRGIRRGQMEGRVWVLCTTAEEADI